MPARLPSPWAHSHATVQLARGLARCGASVELWHRAAWRSGSDLRCHYGRLEFGTRVYRDTERLFPLRLLSGEPFATAQRVVGSVRMALSARAEDADLFFTRTPVVATVLARRGLPTMYEEHHLPSGLERLLLGATGRRPAFRGAVAKADSLGDDLIARGIPERKVTVLANAVDLDRFHAMPARGACRRRLGLPAARPIVGYVGRLCKPGVGDRGARSLIAAFARLELRARDTRPLLLCVGGPADAIPDYASFARAQGLPADRVRFAGAVPWRDVPLWIRACDVMTVPPSDADAVAVGAPLKLFEYMAAETPIVASDRPPVRSILRDGENALLVDADEPDALARAIGRFLEEPGLAQRLAAVARLDVKEHTWERRGEEILRLAGLD